MNNRINEAAMLEREQFERTMHDQLMDYVEELEHRMWLADRAEAESVRLSRESYESTDAVAARNEYLVRLESVQRAASAVMASVRSLDMWGLIRGKP